MIIVTGAAGFIGSCFLEKLNREGIDDIVAVDRLDDSDKWQTACRVCVRLSIWGHVVRRHARMPGLLWTTILRIPANWPCGLFAEKCLSYMLLRRRHTEMERWALTTTRPS